MQIYIQYVKQTFFIEISIGCNWTGTTNSETWACCSSESGSQCGIEEGHCSDDDDCFWHLKCGTGNCQDQNPLSNFPLGSNCCYDPIPCKMKSTIKLLYLLVDGTNFFKDIHTYFCFLLVYSFGAHIPNNIYRVFRHCKVMHFQKLRSLDFFFKSLPIPANSCSSESCHY